jgi:hypothetical protein
MDELGTLNFKAEVKVKNNVLHHFVSLDGGGVSIVLGEALGPEQMSSLGTNRKWHNITTFVFFISFKMIIYTQGGSSETT